MPLQFEEGSSAKSVGIAGDEKFTLTGLENGLKPGLKITLEAKRPSGEVLQIPVKLRIDTAIEVEYYKNGGILPYVLRQLVSTP